MRPAASLSWCAMPRPPRGLGLDQVIPFVLGGAVFAFACGSSAVPSVERAGHSLRWVLLFLLLALAASAALRERARPRISALVIGAAAALGVLALASTTWSVDPRLTFERAATLAVMLVTVALLAHVSAREQ